MLRPKKEELKKVTITEFLKESEKANQKEPEFDMIAMWKELKKHPATMWNPKNNVASLRKMDKKIIEILDVGKPFKI